MPISAVHRTTTPVLDVGYETVGDPGGPPVVLLHGFPYDVRCYDEVAPRLADAGARVVAPYLRGFGPTRFRSAGTLRSGQQAALGQDLVELLDALGIERAVVAGYDWGGRAACVASALFPERVDGLVTVGGYNVQDIAASARPGSPESDKTYWYQYYFHSERGRHALVDDRDALCSLLWRDWSPAWAGAAEAFAASAPSLHNPDFVDTVIHSYRHRYGLVAGDETYEALERRLATSPTIPVPTVVLDSGADGLGDGSGPADDDDRFTGPFERLLLPDVGHVPPQEDPQAFADAVLSLLP
ncbi:alpha/beta fold hydrolase [Solicola sp. PLA-1-18]|uniref:alpha/beta fold hydrolase n=1 Tax=Solicola sp. PLA-1-18 TaxID=3380532 RepID=UPI003B7D5CCD